MKTRGLTPLLPFLSIVLLPLDACKETECLTGPDADAADTADADVGLDEPAPEADCSGQCSARRCGTAGACGAPCGSGSPPAVAASTPTTSTVSMEGTLHAKQEKIVITADGTIHLYIQLSPGGASYARSYDGGATWEAFENLDPQGWLGVIAADDDDSLYTIYASSWDEGGEYRSSPKSIKAPVDKSAARWSWTWGEATILLPPDPPNPRHGFLDFARDSGGTFHLVTAFTSAFSFDTPPDEPVQVGISYFRSTAPDDAGSFEQIDQLLALEIWPFEVPDFALGFGGDPAIAVDGSDNIILVYSDRSLYQSGLTQAEWPDTGSRGALYFKRYLRQGSGWTAEPAQVAARGTYGDADILVGSDGTTHLVYTVVDSGSNYRAAYRSIDADGKIGGEMLLTSADPNATERTIFPSLALLDDGSLVVGFTDRLSQPNGNLGAVMMRSGSGTFGCAVPLTGGAEGSIDINLLSTEVDGSLLFVYLVGSANPYPMRFGRIEAADLLAAAGE